LNKVTFFNSSNIRALILDELKKVTLFKAVGVS